MRKDITNYVLYTALFIAVAGFQTTEAQDASTSKLSPEDATAKANAELEKKAAEWAGELKLSDTAKKKKVTDAVATHLKTVREWNNEHPFTTVPAGINPATGNKLAKLNCNTFRLTVNVNQRLCPNPNVQR